MELKIQQSCRSCFLNGKKETVANLAAAKNQQRQEAKQGFSLLELLIGIAILGIVYVAVFVSVEGLLERWYLRMGANQVMQTLKHAQFLALTLRHSHGIEGAGSELWIIRPDKLQLSEESWESLPADLTLTANRWPSFSPYGFARGGTIAVESEHYLLQVKVGPIGGIRYTEIQSKP